VLQPFDKGAFDKRYDDVFAPAIKKAGLEAYRVDRDPSAIIPIDTIEKNIKDADACLADISKENPNVWYEVGYAFASGKEVVLVCKEGSTFPFDVRHRSIITYPTDSPRDFQKLQRDITQRLEALAEKEKMIVELTPVKPTRGLTAVEIVALALIMEDSLSLNPGIVGERVADDLDRAGFTRIAAALAIQGLLTKGYIENIVCHEEYGNTYESYKITSEGIQWCVDNQNKFTLQHDPPALRGRPELTSPPQPPRENDDEEEIPF